MNMTRITLTALLVLLFPWPGGAELRAQESGPDLWGRTCTRCHNARPLNERTDREWTTIVQHMRARANLSREDARTILQFLQAANAPEAGTVSEAARRPSGTDEATGIEIDAAGELVEGSTALDAAQIAALVTYLSRATRREESTP